MPKSILLVIDTSLKLFFAMCLARIPLLIKDKLPLILGMITRERSIASKETITKRGVCEATSSRMQQKRKRSVVLYPNNLDPTTTKNRTKNQTTKKNASWAIIRRGRYGMVLYLYHST